MIEELDLRTEDGREMCYICGRTNWIEHHHVFGGANRKISDKYGLVVPLCHFCHNEPPNGVHHNFENMEKLQQAVQLIAMEHYGWNKEDFIKIFGRNFLYE